MRDRIKIARETNLVLANREARLTAPSGEDLSGENAYAALRAANQKVGQFSESQILVGLEGIEPSTPGLKGRRSTAELQTHIHMVSYDIINFL